MSHETVARERGRLLAALHHMAQCGCVQDIQPIGSAHVLNDVGACIDLALNVWPFPLETHRVVALQSLGYDFVPSYEGGPEQRMRNVSGAIQLFIVESGGERWLNHLLIRDYLCGDAMALANYSAQRSAGAWRSDEARAAYFENLLEPASAWHIEHAGFAPMQVIANELTNLQYPWFIASGWALDLFLGKVTRPHHDVDIVIARNDQLAFRAHLESRGWTCVAPLNGKLEPWPPHMLLELPRHQIHAFRDGAFLDVLITDLDEAIWRYRREPLVLRHAARMSLRAGNGIPFLAPELVLLFKSKNTSSKARDKDQADFEAVLPHLDPEQRAWLRWALVATVPDHTWINRLA